MYNHLDNTLFNVELMLSCILVHSSALEEKKRAMAQAEEDRRRRVLEERRRQQQAATDRFHSAITRLKQSRQPPQQERGDRLISTLPVESELNL